ncbi:MAG: SprT family zinc-dependent metalloprotease [Rickettsiales bacterium]
MSALYDFKVNEELTIPVRIVKNFKYKRISIKKSLRETGFKVTAPFFVLDRTIHNFIKQNHSWLIRHHKYTAEHQEYKSGAKIKIFGDEHKIQLADSLRGTTHIDQENLIVYGTEAAIKSKIHNFCKKLLLSQVKEILDFHSKSLEVKYSGVTIRDTNSRWGSCSSSGRVMLSLKLIQCPFDIVEYVLVHELCHLIEMNHSKSFWKLVATQYPEYKTAERWLKSKGKEIRIL